MRWSTPPLPAIALAGLLASAALTACGRGEPTVPVEPPGPGIPEALAVERAQRIRDLRYEIRFDLPADASAAIPGQMTVRFRLTDATRPLALDFAPGAASLGAVTIEGATIAYTAVDDHVVIPAANLRDGENAIDITFTAGNAALNRNPDFLYTLFVPARAHLVFPCFDQPDLKARWDLTLSMPSDWQATANGEELGRTREHDRLAIHYRETLPIPTYLFAFVAGRFEVETAERRGRTFRMFHRETDAAKLSRNREAIFDLHAAALSWLEDYTDIPYAFGKFDFVMVPSFQFSGMEHPGAILYNASSMLLDESATENQMLGRASTIAHETAHMWFGDLVTMRWFDDVWMKEVFANFMAAKIVNPSFPAINHELRFLTAHYPQAYGVDRTAGTHPIRQPLDNLSNAGTQYGAIIYQKAPIVMRQLEQLLGEEAMREGLRQYLGQFKFGNATWLDLVKILDDRSERDLAAWSRAWVEEAGMPTISTELSRDARGAISDLAFTQRDPRHGPDSQLTWTERMEVVLGAADGTTRVVPVELSAGRTPVPAAAGMTGIRFVLPTGGGLAYGSFNLDDGSRATLLSMIPKLKDPVTRGAAWLTLWEELLERRVRPQVFIDAVLAALPQEDVQQNQQLMVGYLREAYWRFITPDARVRRAPVIERVMREGLARGSTASAKSIFWNGFRAMALTPAGIAYLEQVWARTEKIAGLPFAETDEATMALDLAVRGRPNASGILQAQLARMTNPDRKARFAFVIPAVSSSQEERGRFFDNLSDVVNRRREPWVIEALSYLHHPLRAAHAAQFVRPSLERLQEIQRTGDIFFPKNWMDATLSGHASPEVAITVRQFLQERPDYPIRLRRVILQSADELFRAVDTLADTADRERP